MHFCPINWRKPMQLALLVPQAPVTPRPFGPGIENAWTKIDSIDLSNVKRKLTLPLPEGSGWDTEAADLAIKWYRRYLKICAKYMGRGLVPSREIDEVWHLHILDTRAYASDCMNVFGHMLHHNPYFGMNGDAKQRDDGFVRTNMLYLAEFGEMGLGYGTMCDSDGTGGGVGGNVHPSMCDSDGTGGGVVN